MLKAYIDGSGTGDPQVFVMAGYIAPAEQWASFTIDWQQFLDHYRLPAFKMNEAAHRWLSRNEIEPIQHFYSVIERHVSAAIAIVIDVPALRRVADSLLWLPGTNVDMFKNPYFFAFKYVIAGLAANQEKAGFFEPVDFIFDEDREKQAIDLAWDHFKQNVLSTRFGGVVKYVGDPPIFRNDTRTLPLQSADLLGWWVRKQWLDAPSDEPREIDWPWQTKRQLPMFARVYREREVMRDMARDAGIKGTVSAGFPALWHAV